MSRVPCSLPDLSSPALLPFLLCPLVDLICTFRVSVRMCAVPVCVNHCCLLAWCSAGISQLQQGKKEQEAKMVVSQEPKPDKQRPLHATS